MKTHDWYDPSLLKTKEQELINSYFKFRVGGAATCNLHNTPMCQQCTNLAFKHLSDEKEKTDERTS